MISTIAALRSRLAEARAAAAGRSRVALVTTMGGLHAGHTDLIRRAQELADIVVVSVFVNRMRFRTLEEAAAYPRTPEADAALLADLGVEIVFAPDDSELLPTGLDTTKVTAGDLGLRYEGRSRPFYFDGLLTVEAKLLQLVRPDVAVYGERDLQRVYLVRRMVRDLFLDVKIDQVPTVRASSGLPYSSRVPLLDAADLDAARGLPRALEAAASNADRGVDACIAAAQSALMGEPRIHLDYLNIVDPASFLPVDEDHAGPAVALIAATVDGHRFIDNAPILLP